MSMHVMRSAYKVKIIEVNICINFALIHVCVGSMDNVDDIHLSFFIMTGLLIFCDVAISHN